MTTEATQQSNYEDDLIKFYFWLHVVCLMFMLLNESSRHHCEGKQACSHFG